ncbi:hypothetical protein ACIRJO_02800 [Streptomyces sp. NPDC102394]|uniref:hypothetical protein n=1 Tax=Streptomyces sp. NPDC102394 TaxID=3366167 RepID=UPI0038236B2A
MAAPLPPGREQGIRYAVAAYLNHPDTGFACCSAHPAADGARELLAEVDRLRRELKEWAADKAAALRAAADALEREQAREERAERERFGYLDHETELQGVAVRAKAAFLRRLADNAERGKDTSGGDQLSAGESTPEVTRLQAENRVLRAAQPGNAKLYDTAVALERERNALRKEIANLEKVCRELHDGINRIANEADAREVAGGKVTADRIRVRAAELKVPSDIINQLLQDSDAAVAMLKAAGQLPLATTDLLAHATSFEIDWPGRFRKLLIHRSYAGGDRWWIADREGRRWHRTLGFVYEAQNEDERTRTDTRFPLAEAWPLAHAIATDETAARADGPDGVSQ